MQAALLSQSVSRFYRIYILNRVIISSSLPILIQIENIYSIDRDTSCFSFPILIQVLYTLSTNTSCFTLPILTQGLYIYF